MFSTRRTNEWSVISSKFDRANGISGYDFIMPTSEIIPRFLSHLSSDERKYKDMDMLYFTFHRELESTHEDAMENVIGVHSNDQKDKVLIIS